MNFWDQHGIFFLVAMFFFPRLTLLFSSVPFGGILWWIGFFFAPRILVAILASIAYWETNPILVTIAWIWALSGETFEKRKVLEKKYYKPFVYYRKTSHHKNTENQEIKTVFDETKK